ncbi:MAG: 50S ribosomal protein L22 [Planctomycetota bacterium]
MEFKASHNHARITPRKVRPIADLVKGMPVNRALQVLKFNHRRGAYLLLKVIRSAVANAEQNADVDLNKLVVKNAVINGGPLLGGRARFRPVSRGRVASIKKRTSHIIVHLAQSDAAPAEGAKATEQV